MHRRVVVEQRQEHHDAFGDRRSKARVEPAPAMEVPPFDSIELMPAGLPAGALCTPDLERDVVLVQMDLQGGIVGMRHLVLSLREPMTPRKLGAMELVLFAW